MPPAPSQRLTTLFECNELKLDGFPLAKPVAPHGLAGLAVHLISRVSRAIATSSIVQQRVETPRAGIDCPARASDKQRGVEGRSDTTLPAAAAAFK